MPNLEPEFQPSERLLAMRENDWKTLSEADFNALFKHSAMQRAGYEGLKRNIEFLNCEDAAHDDGR
jgi:epoxyqueuosine reductase